MSELATVLIVLILVMAWILATMFVFHATVVDPPKKGQLPSPRYSMVVLVSLTYSLALPIVTVGYGVSLVLGKLF